MNGILLIDKPKGITSRDVVNFAIKKLGVRKIGHTGTLDPIATGVMVLCVGSATKLVDLLTSHDKEYLAEVTLGIKTDTLDITGTILEESKVSVTREQIENVINSFVGTYNQEVPAYSAVKVNGRKLYEYARNHESVVLPSKDVTIKQIELIDYQKSDKIRFSFKCLVSKGTFIRSLIRDICAKLNVIGTMSKLERTKQGHFYIDKCIMMEDINNDKIINIEEVLDIPYIKVNNSLKRQILNGQVLNNIYGKDLIGFKDENDHLIAIYKKYEKDIQKIKPYVMLEHKEEII